MAQPRFVAARGAAESVPRYLRANGLVRAHDMSKQETERLVRACWAAKAKEEARLRREEADEGLVLPLADFFWEWLRTTFGGPGQAVEWGSAIALALQRYSYDADVDVFLRCLQGRLPEEVYSRGGLVVARLEHGLSQRDRALSGGQTTGFLTVDDIRSYVREAFPHKSRAAMTAVLASLAIDPAVQAAAGPAATSARHRALATAARGDVAPSFASTAAATAATAGAAALSGAERVDYSRLLSENAVGDQGPFVETLRAQLVSDFLQYAAELTAAVEQASTGPTDDELEVTPAAAAAAIRAEDPAKPDAEVRVIVARGTGVHPSELDVALSEPVRTLEFVSRMRSGWLARSGPKPLA
ncbi:hypothetical protein FNF27_03721 [Cafeteria roenbergensis]|uniref:Uncharacterized protein n=1 Tax=Cafeteria roenbergensis TaxID=33653 RepID=A0A5A8EAI2_CAFRO|nr:hypothetical protein FNF27_03721 [Cafeteria roenbergensis]